MNETATALAEIAEAQKGAIQLLLDLEAAGACDEVSLTLTNVDMPYSQWEDLGRFLGSIDRRSRWYIGDWLNFGEAIFGQDASQATDDIHTRYDEAERVTGLDHATLLNVSSICGRITRSRRRKELGFWIHGEVAALDAEEQTEWLQRTIDEKWTRAELRDALRAAKNPPGPEPEPEPAEGDPPLSRSEMIEQAAYRVYHKAQPTSDGGVQVPAEPWAGLRAALGEE